MSKEKRSRKKRTVGALGIIGGVLFALALSALAIGLMYLYGENREAPAGLRSAGDVTAQTVSLYTQSAPLIGETPETAAAPEAEVLSTESYEEVLYDEDGLLVAKILGKRYVGYLTVIEDPLRVTLGKCPYFSETAYGRTVKQMADEAGAVLAVNGGGFSDPGGAGNGGYPTGNVIYEGRILSGYLSPTVGMDANGRLYVGDFTGTACLELGMQWAVSYGPTLIVDGNICDGLADNGGEPRTAIGQREDGSIVIVVLQGRQLQALGVTVRELADIMAGYGCVNASNLDGGASSDIYFHGEYLNVCNTSGGPRPIPTALLIMPTAGEDTP